MAGFKLLKWCVNHFGKYIKLKSRIRFYLCGKSLKKKTIKICGIVTVTSDKAHFYDPLGLATPLTIKANLTTQQLMQLKLSWDGSLPSKLPKKWVMFCRSLKALQN